MLKANNITLENVKKISLLGFNSYNDMESL